MIGELTRRETSSHPAFSAANSRTVSFIREPVVPGQAEHVVELLLPHRAENGVTRQHVHMFFHANPKSEIDKNPECVFLRYVVWVWGVVVRLSVGEVWSADKGGFQCFALCCSAVIWDVTLLHTGIMTTCFVYFLGKQ